MAWSARIFSGSGGAVGRNDFELVFDPSTQTSYKLKYGARLGNQAPEVLYHTPDNGPPVPVRVKGTNRLIFLELHVPPQTDWDEVNFHVENLTRLVGGADSQAAEYSLTGTAEKVRCSITPDGATLTTYFEVLHGFVDANEALTRSEAKLNTMAYNIVIALTCPPSGFGDTISLSNELKGSPNMLRATGGVVEGFSIYGNATGALDSTKTLIGPTSWEVTGTTPIGGTRGFRSDAVTAGTSEEAVIGVWVNGTSGECIIRLTDGAGTEVSKLTFDPTDPVDYTRTRIGRSGETWYLYEISHGGSPARGAANVIMETEWTDTSVFYFDGALAKTGTETLPVAFSSGYYVRNRLDTDTNEDYRNFIDVAMIPGDQWADMSVYSSQSTSGIFHDGLVVAGIAEKDVDVTDWYHWSHAPTDLTTTTGSPATTADASRQGGSYLRWSGGTSGTAEYPAPTGLGATGWSGFESWLDTIMTRVYVFARASDVTSTIRVQWTGVTSGTNEYVSFDTANTWEVLDLGLVNARVSPGLNAIIIPKLTIVNAAGTVDIEGLFYCPSSSGAFALVPMADTTPVGNNIRLRHGEKVATVQRNFGTAVGTHSWAPHFMGYWRIPSGPRMSRVFLLHFSDYATTNPQRYDISNDSYVTLRIVPRTSHLLGV